MQSISSPTQPRRILLPIDIARCPTEAFEVLGRFADKPEVTVILLHVVNLNIVAPENGIYEELAREADWYLQRLADRHISRFATTDIHVRAGIPAEQILAEAIEQKTDLIILPNLTSPRSRWVVSFWKPHPGPYLPRGLQRVINESSCGVFVFNSAQWFDCREAWPLPRTHAVPSLTSF